MGSKGALPGPCLLDAHPAHTNPISLPASVLCSLSDSSVAPARSPAPALPPHLLGVTWQLGAVKVLGVLRHPHQVAAPA